MAAFSLLRGTCLRHVCSPGTPYVRAQRLTVLLTKGRAPNRDLRARFHECTAGETSDVTTVRENM